MNVKTCLACKEKFVASKRTRSFCSVQCSNSGRHPSLIERFMAKVEVSADGCWVWRGFKNKIKLPYGHFRADGRTVAAHRFAWTWFRGPIPNGLMVCHHCDQPDCVNPDHLFVGTNQDNVNDRARKGRSNYAYGHLAAAAKLTREQALEVRKKAAEGVPDRMLAAEYGMGLVAIQRLLRGETYAR